MKRQTVINLGIEMFLMLLALSFIGLAFFFIFSAGCQSTVRITPGSATAREEHTKIIVRDQVPPAPATTEYIRVRVIETGDRHANPATRPAPAPCPPGPGPAAPR
jgi:hypothetical protein